MAQGKMAHTLILSRLMTLVRTQAIVSSCSTSGVQRGSTIAFCIRTMDLKMVGAERFELPTFSM